VIEDYFLQVENILRDFPAIQAYELTKKVYNIHQGYIGGKITFDSGSSLEFIEVVDTERPAKIKYRYQYMDKSRSLVFRYDNAPHHPEIASFPHHKHIPEHHLESKEPDLESVLFEITRLLQNK